MPRKTVGPHATHEMLRAFLALADKLNLTEASDTLGLTRQTVRRYIDILEAMKGAPLFALKKNNYVLTKFGEASLAEARNILDRTERFCSPASLRPGIALSRSTNTFFDDAGRAFHIVQHPISTIAKAACPLLQKAHVAWAVAQMRLESDEMRSLRPYLVVYRRDMQGWRCVEIGEQSAYARWFGWTWSKSAVGKLSYEDEAGDEFDEVVSDIYSTVVEYGGSRLDHVFAHLPRESETEPQPVTFQRLLLTCLLPDETPVIVVLVAITSDVQIDSLESKGSVVIPPELDMSAE